MNDDRATNEPRQRGAKYPAVLRTGLIVFAVGVVVASIFGIAANVFPQDVPEGVLVIEFIRRCGLVVMLAGLLIVLCCFPTAQRWAGGIISFVKARLKFILEPSALRASSQLPIQASLVEEPPPGVPLSALFLGLAAAAVLCGLIAPVFGGDDVDRGPIKLLIIAASAASLAILVGIVVLIATRSLPTTGALAVAAFICGAVVPALIFLPKERFDSAALTSILGCGGMLVAAIIGRRKRQEK